MQLIGSFFRLADIRMNKISKSEMIVLEYYLFCHICNTLKEFFRSQYKNYFYLIKFGKSMEDVMLDTNFIRLVVNDILSTEEYSLAGIAYDTHTPKEVIYEISAGINTDPSLSVSRKIIQTHQFVRPGFYRDIFNKAIKE